MKLTVLLCDFAQVADSKLYLSGAGWNIAGPGPVPCGLGILVEVPWDRANTPVKLSIELREQDGPVVTQNGLTGEQPVLGSPARSGPSCWYNKGLAPQRPAGD